MWHKLPAPINHRYLEGLRGFINDSGVRLESATGSVEASLWSNGIARVCFRGGDSDATQHDHTKLTPGDVAGKATQLGKDFVLAHEEQRLRLHGPDGSFVYTLGGVEVLKSAPAPFGQTGARKVALFEHEDGAVVYGLGEKTGGLDKSGRSWHFWTVDVVADHPHNCDSDYFDPSYVSIPFYISKRGDQWFGVLLANPYRTYVHAGLKAEPGRLFHPSLGLRDPSDVHFALGTWDGDLDLWLIPGPTLGDVVRRFAALTGVHEMPPLWALGYHQCRWSYMTAAELQHISDRLDEYRIPTGAIWMDINYMDDFRVFTWDPKTYGETERRAAFARIHERGTRLVTIVDPGVRAEPGYGVYDDGMRHDVFCRTEAGDPYIGFVWPGRTVFPDFSIASARHFWAERIAKWLDSGLDGIWNDMNDPSSGPVDLTDMRFGSGKVPHEAFHNQYGNLMAQATLEGFERRNPDARPFILTRSASTGAQRLCAVWTGDNASSESHLAMSIPMSINLALSGVSFNGPDVGGFMKDVSEDLLVTWMLAGALFPFLRNHSCMGTRRQEPWMFQPESVEVMRKAINTRSKLMPYLYNEFHRHYRHGDAVMRPVAYEFPGAEYERIGDQFFIGPSIMAAPFTNTKDNERSVVLPPGWWFDLRTGQWTEGGRTVRVPRDRRMILYVRDGAVIPVLSGSDHYPQPDFHRLEFHVFMREAREATIEYFEDDGLTRGYQRGAYNLMELTIGALGKPTASIEWKHRGFPAGARTATLQFHGWAPKDAVAGESHWPFLTIATQRVVLPLG